MIIQTYSGRAFDLLHPTPEMIHWMDVSVALARINRFHGHSTWCEWPVAQHSILAMIYGTDVNEADNETRLALLLHDAAEAYCQDIAAPLRVAMRTRYLQTQPDWSALNIETPTLVDPYLSIYRGVQEAVRQWAKLPEGAFDTATVKQVDLRMLATERELFLARPWIPDWILLPPPYVTETDLAPPTMLSPEGKKQVNSKALLWAPWNPQTAALRFAACLSDLAPHIGMDMSKNEPNPWDPPPWARALIGG